PGDRRNRSRPFHERRRQRVLRRRRSQIPRGLCDRSRAALRITFESVTSGRSTRTVHCAVVSKMTSQTLIGALLLLMSGFGISEVGAQSARDEAEIRDLQVRQQEAWNRHDARAYA